MKQVRETAEEKDHFMGLDMERITEISIPEKMSILSNMTTLTIDIQKILQLDGFPTSPSNDSSSNCRSLRTEKTNHQTS